MTCVKGLAVVRVFLHSTACLSYFIGRLMPIWISMQWLVSNPTFSSIQIFHGLLSILLSCIHSFCFECSEGHELEQLSVCIHCIETNSKQEAWDAVAEQVNHQSYLMSQIIENGMLNLDIILNWGEAAMPLQRIGICHVSRMKHSNKLGSLAMHGSQKPCHSEQRIRSTYLIAQQWSILQTTSLISPSTSTSPFMHQYWRGLRVWKGIGEFHKYTVNRGGLMESMRGNAYFSLLVASQRYLPVVNDFIRRTCFIPVLEEWSSKYSPQFNNDPSDGRMAWGWYDLYRVVIAFVVWS